MSWDVNAYSTPEKFELTIVGHLDDPNACYSFDDLIVWQHADGRLFYAEDAGCSCPCPFEDFDSLATLTPITDESWGEFQSAVEAHCRSEWRIREGESDPQAADKTQLLAKVARLMREATA